MVNAFWFGELTTDDWFRQSYQHCDRVKTEFGGLHSRAVAGELSGWMERPETCLALVVLYDQFSRFIYRGAPEEKAWDPQARLAATVALQRGDDKQFTTTARRIALYLPFMHSEDIADKRRFISLMRSGLAPKPKGAWAEASTGSAPARQRALGASLSESWQRETSTQRGSDSSESDEEGAEPQERRGAQRGRSEPPRGAQRPEHEQPSASSSFDPDRGVAVCMLELRNGEGQLLVHVAKWEGGKAHPLCQLPGTKQKSSEFPCEAVKRLLSDLKQLVPHAKIKKTEREASWKMSPIYGTRTRYVRTKYLAVLVQQPSRLALVPVPLSRRDAGDGGQRPDTIIALHQVYMLGDGRLANNAYAWMLPEEFEHLSGPGGSKTLERWIGALDLRASAVHVPPPREDEEEDRSDWRENADLAQGLGRSAQSMGYSMQAARDGVPILPVLTMNHEHSKRFRTMRLDPQTQQAYQRDRKEINRTVRYQCLVCAVTHEFRLCEPQGGAEHQHHHK